MGRKFSAEGIMHIYQRTISGFNLFYSLEDFLVFYTIVSIQSRKFGLFLCFQSYADCCIHFRIYIFICQ